MKGVPFDYAKYAACMFLVYVSTLLVYRYFIHTLSHIPGPFLAKFTYLYEWYFDLYLDGQFTFQLEELHRKFGPVVRINPDEAHIYDPDLLESVFNQTNGRVDKPPQVAGAFGPYPATIGTASHELHRLRRSALSPFFSKKSINDLAPVMWKPIHILCERLSLACKENQPVNMKYIFAAVTLDIINAYCFGHEPVNVCKLDFARKDFDDVDSFLKVSLINIHIPWAMRFTYSLPDGLNSILAPAMTNILEFRRGLSRQVEEIRNRKEMIQKVETKRTIFHELLGSKLPVAELTPDRLRDEAFSLVTAGSGTTAYVLRGTAYHVCANPEIRKRLYEELKVAMPEVISETIPSLSKLEQLPYLAAIVQEGLCLCYVIPAGSTVSLTATLTHQNEDIFPEPYTFRPERWLERNQRLDRYLVPFNRGTRSCLGTNLARAEMFLILAAVFRRFDFDVSQVSRERDIDVRHDYILGAQARDSPGLIVLPRNMET
ncbi:benzoate 4-monooxygenase cytochrome P450 [Penicillium daleae]|uniref:Benzoate 4-monooxygenase cytochrome P450 n=1 Tax=Penicillium daleae TaxID=63821 RepID=A0AAD6BWR4_9EURO|nr:benzoate 4-monooxygenase cytochrome P450 [Penicillium daleae]KAJ5438316.1 benzoate 4-monooxygenase cytochrome P450 [Penicillium daleae]